MINIMVSLFVSDRTWGKGTGEVSSKQEPSVVYYSSIIKPSKGEEGQIKKTICLPLKTTGLPPLGLNRHLPGQ